MEIPFSIFGDFAVTVPMFLILIVFMNRYWLGSALLPFPGKNPKRLEVSELPSVTVIIPLYNEGASIYQTLKSISEQDYPTHLIKIIVVDDCSTDDSNEWANKAAEEDGRIQVHRNPINIGKRLGIARAVQEADSEMIVSVDSDVILEAGAITKLISRFGEPAVAAVGGRVWVSNAHQNWLSRMQTIKYYFGYEYLKNIERACGTVMCLSGCLTAYRRDVLILLEPILLSRSLSGMPIKYGEDRFLTRQIVKAGYLTQLELEAGCRTKVPTTIDGYFSQQIRWRRSNIVDFIGGVTHIWRVHPLVAMHFLSINALVLSYPLVLWLSMIYGTFFHAACIHLGVLGAFATIYWIKTRKIPAALRVDPVNFLWMGVLMPVTYMVLSVLALFTLDSGSWETRKKHVPQKITP